MARLSRYTQLLFASLAGTNQIAEFGSLFAGSPQRYDGSTVTPALVQAISNYLDGWESAAIGGNAPAIEDMNAICYLFSYQLAYLMQTGIAEWDSATTYYIGDVAQDGAGNFYVSVTDSNLNNALSSTTNWKSGMNNVFTTLGDLAYSAANGVPTRLAGPTGANRYFLSSTGSGSAATAPVWTLAKQPTQTILSNITATNITGTYTPPTGCVRIRVRANGGGGGTPRFASSTGNANITSGGGAGAYFEKTYNSLASSYSYQVGCTGVTALIGNSGTGGDTIFGAYTAGGGQVGIVGTIGTAAQALDGGAGGVITGTPDLPCPGAAAPTSYMVSVSLLIVGAGAPSIYGGGGAAFPLLTGIAQGNSAGAPGAGASGGAAIGASSGAKGDGVGGPGYIIIDEFYF